jgi:hypothetical protein
VTFDLSGVLLSTNGKSGEVDAVLSEQSGSVNLAQSVVPVIGAVTAGLADPVVPSTLPSGVTGAPGLATVTGGPAVLNSAGGAIKGNFTVKIAENFASMLQSANQYNGGIGGVFPSSTSSNTQVNVVFKNVPAGLNISGCVVTLTDSTGTATTATAAGSVVASQNAVTSASNTITLNVNGNMDLTAIDVLWLTCTSVGAGTATLPLPSAAVTVQVELGPLGTALTSLGAAQTGLSTGLIPRYQDVLQPATAVPVILFPPSQTTLLVTFAVVVPGFNTGIAVSNTTTDVFAGNGGATPTDGTIVFTLFKNDGTSKTFTSPTVKSGTTFAANLSDIIATAGAGPTFSGYIFAQANFPQAHGAATIYDTGSGHAALSTPVLVVQSGGANVTLAAPRVSPESLSQ